MKNKILATLAIILMMAGVFFLCIFVNTNDALSGVIGLCLIALPFFGAIITGKLNELIELIMPTYKDT